MQIRIHKLRSTTVDQGVIAPNCPICILTTATSTCYLVAINQSGRFFNARKIFLFQGVYPCKW